MHPLLIRVMGYLCLIQVATCQIDIGSALLLEYAYVTSDDVADSFTRYTDWGSGIFSLFLFHSSVSSYRFLFFGFLCNWEAFVMELWYSCPLSIEEDIG